CNCPWLAAALGVAQGGQAGRVAILASEAYGPWMASSHKGIEHYGAEAVRLRERATHAHYPAHRQLISVAEAHEQLARSAAAPVAMWFRLVASAFLLWMTYDIASARADDAQDCYNAQTLVKSDPAKPVAACRKLADQGIPKAQFNLGLMY